ncbi:hypothetical protein [Halolamina salifodinae]|uniref:Uncharacterized protein n=1 Tax=Halolamina salifodinae TaxID=1202767 RepID=A0A8T4H341_9EURY|nr:hypothetical protein [Halolamina salifodinae]MBP1988045.1 hypothetical protein [Halolamina salifodinae]
MDHTRRKLLGAASALIATAGCLGGDDATATPTDDPSTATATTTARPTPSETPTDEPTEEPTEEPTQTESTVRIWPTGVTAIFDGDVDATTIDDAMEDDPGSTAMYGGQREGEPVTYFLTFTDSQYPSGLRDTFEAADSLSVREVFRGVGPSYREEYRSALAQQAAERADIDPDSVSVIPGRLGDHQFLDISAPAPNSALVPMLPDLELQRANGGSEEPIVGPEGVDAEADFFISQRRAGMTDVQFSLTEAGVESFADAVAAASDEELRGDFFRPVVGGEAFRPFSITENFATAVENGDWDGTFAFGVERRSGDGPAISRLTGGLPPIPFQFVPSPD